ncbi:MAG: VWA domain-containing protein [Microlunatus sp.]|nr:VWA domain-containing protein [Microlunatus sp.]MDN5770492.1 VWA domain-containing protein [Microlunatus sp.]MDN5803624.1 VWA domain-containing protein [Microlunatus sp.]
MNSSEQTESAQDQRLTRWRLLLGEPGAEGLGVELGDDESEMDQALAALYDSEPPIERSDRRPGPNDRTARLGASAPQVARWLGDIRTYFPTSVVQVMQRDAIERLDLTSLLLEPELLRTVQPDVHLVATLVGLSSVMPETTRATARAVVGEVVAEIERRIAERTRSAVGGAINRAARTRQPRAADIDWLATIGRNLDHYLPEHQTVVPERLVGHARSAKALACDVVVAIDQSSSMAESVVYASVFAAVLASLHTVRTSLVAFDTAVVDLTELLDDPVAALFGCQLGGGTDINRAVAYCGQLVTRPTETVLLLITDLFEGGDGNELMRRLVGLHRDRVRVVVLLALSDEGTPCYDHDRAAVLAEIGIPALACTPDAFPDLLAVAIARGDVAGWGAGQTAGENR